MMLKKDLKIEDFNIYQYVRLEEIREMMGKRRFKKFNKWMGGQTCPMIGNEVAVYPCDLENYLRKPEGRFFD